MNNQATATKWTSGQSTSGKELVTRTLMSDAPKTVTKKGNDFYGLGGIGSHFGGECIGVDEKGWEVMIKQSIYKRPPKANTATRSNFAIG